MQFKCIALFLWLCGLSSVSVSIAFEENNKFCIHTTPLLLADIEKHINPIANDPQCEVLATTLTVKEKESFLSTMCKDLNATHKDDYQFFKLRNGELTGLGSYHDICDGKTAPLLAWVPYKMLQRNYAQELNPKDRSLYIAKATDVAREKSELCHFRHADLVNNIPENLFTCILMIFEDNFFDLGSNINVLVEIQPIMYEVLNITYLPWVNVTTSYKTLLGKTALKNPSRERKQIYGSLNYAYIEKLQLNASTVYGAQLEKLPLLFEHKGAVLELNDLGIGGLDIKEKAYFGRTMDPKTNVNIFVFGQWAEHRKQFTADIYEYFGYGIKRYRYEIHKGAVAIVLIESTEPVFEAPESTHLTNNSQYKINKTQSQQSYERLSIINDDVEDFEPIRPRGGNPYPGFYGYAVAGAILIAIVLLSAVIGMVHHCSKDKDNHKYGLTSS